ncbi:M13 family metallopeptidase [Nitrospirillum sp. BR 11164]|uniref:M13 family metallopeptidase n=1 Tax=Nitrospirillum sp. BR 11164 TaxID=3104324 RepID=UPI002AFEA81A|nr:M13 family metallopeptidase [Nitrospirillum sp. BR 11164]MEA1647880.1 M13 family metallopeptidase [Nitrospirillum sp. BR 11164]
MNSADPAKGTSRRGVLASAAAALCFSLLPKRSPAAATPPAIGTWGFDIAGMDPRVRPGDDFFRHGGGSWLANTPIPPDRAAWGPFFALRAKAEADVRVILDDLTRRPQKPGATEQKIADFYTAYLDTAAIEGAGLSPIQENLAAFAQAGSHEEVARLMARVDLGAGGPFSIDIWADDKDPDRYTVNVSQAGLGMPDRDYYLKAEASFIDGRNKYRTYIEGMLSLAGHPQPGAAAAGILSLETAIAALHWPAEKRGDRTLTYNPRTRAALMTLAPDFPWADVFATLDIPEDHDLFGAKEPDAIQRLATLFRATPLQTWRSYLAFHHLNAVADLLPLAFDDLAFDFNGRTLSGQPRKRERWKRATGAVNAALGEAVGALYVRRHFSADAKAQVVALVEMLRAAYRMRIAQAAWMAPATRQAALRKLDKLRVKIGYPDTWRDYTTLEVRPGDPVGNRARARLWEWRRKAGRLGKPTDKDEWGMTPQTVNAYYNAFFNEIVFPAAILQPPYFDPAADPAVNYGGIGGVIGHEMGHAFDDQGAKSDENGVLHAWWTDEDVARFRARVDALAAQYSRYEPLPGLRINGAMTLAENIGDNSGLSMALDAYRMSRGTGRRP